MIKSNLDSIRGLNEKKHAEMHANICHGCRFEKIKHSIASF